MPDKNDERYLVQGAWDEEDLEFLSRVHKWKKEAKNVIDDWLQEELREHGYYAGHQWTAEEYDEIKKSGREPLTLNRIQAIVDVVLGQERANRTRVKYLPVDTLDDIGKADIMSEVVRVVQEQSDSDYEKSDAFSDMFQSGRGFVEVRYDTTDDPDGKICVEYLDPQEILYDPLAKKYDLSDARYFIRHKQTSLEEIYLQWPEKADSLDAMSGMAKSSSGVSVESDDDYLSPLKYITDSYNKQTKSWEILEIWYWQVIKQIKALNPETNQWEDLKDAKSLEALQTIAAGMGIEIQSQSIYEKKYYHAFTCGSVVLEHEESPHEYQGFPIIPFQGKVDKISGRRFGIIRALIDPQFESNKRRTQVLHILNRAAKSGFMGPEGSFIDRDSWENESSLPGALLEYRIIDGQRPEPILPQTLPAIFLELEKLFVTDLRDISGINVEMLGLSTKDTPGIVTSQRIRQGMIILQVFMDNLRRSTKHLGRVMLSFIKQYYMNRLMVITGKNGPQQVMITPDLIGKYDLVVEDAPWSPNQRQETLGLLMQVLPLALNAGIPVPPQVIDYLGLPQQLAEDWKAMLQPQPPGAGGPGMGGGGGMPPEMGGPQAAMNLQGGQIPPGVM